MPCTPWMLVIAAGIVLGLALGQRHSTGLYQLPLTQDFGLSREAFSFAFALQNIVWGIGQPFAGYIADRYGTARVVACGALLYAAGLALATISDSRSALSLSAGLLIGLGLAGTGWTVNGAVGRAVPEHARSRALGLVSALGALGQFLMLPFGLFAINALGWRGALLLCAVLLALIAPLSWWLREPRARPPGEAAESTPPAAGAKLSDDESTAPASSGETPVVSIGAALRSRNLWLLCAGFTACGFHLAFIATHLPAFLSDRGLGTQTATLALALVGLFNIVGTYLFGVLGQRHPKKFVLAWLYALRTLVIVLYVGLPITHLSTLIFAATMGFLWLGTAPVTTGLVAHLYGLRSLSTLFGIVFFGHQVGSFLGVWLGGWVFDRTGSYDLVWGLAILIGVFSTLIHLPIEERRAPRPLAQAA